MADSFSREISRVVAGQLAEVAGYESVQDSAAEVLGELLIKYITELSASSHGYAELANRTGINVHDILLALDDLGTSVPELQGYLSSLTSEDNTFAHPLPQYPVQKPGRKLPTFQDKQEAAPAHIPAFLPAFPDKHTYLQTPKFPGHEADPAKQSQMVQQARRQAEKSLVKLHYNLSNPAAAAAAASTQGVDGVGVASEAAAGPAAAAPPSTAGPDQLPATSPPPPSISGASPTLPSSSAAAPALAAAAGSSNPFLAPPQKIVLTPGAVQPQMPWHSVQSSSSRQAFVPDAALNAFQAVLPAEATGGGASVQGGQDAGAPEEEMALVMESSVFEAGQQKEPLGSAHDYSTQAFKAAQAAASAKAPEDAYKKAKSAEETADALGGRRSGKQSKGFAEIAEESKHPAQKILEAGSLAVDRAMEGEGE